MRGEKERQCLDLVKSLLNCSCYYGMSEDDCTQFETIIYTAKDNPEPSKFPDFISENGFIEHFQITSSYSNRKGSVHQREYCLFSKEMDNKMQILENELNENVRLGEIRTTTGIFEYPKHSYENLEKSFKGSWVHHISSLDRYQGNKNVGIFMINYQEKILKRCINFDVQCELYYGDLLVREKNPWYTLSRDRNLLNFAYGYKDKIKYIVFLNIDRLEIINTAYIQEILKLIPWEYTVYPCHCVKEQSTIIGTSVPYYLEKRSDTIDNTREIDT